MRGAERPGKVRWTHPFLLPLEPLSDKATRQTFLDIADGSHDSGTVNQLLCLTDNMPLAVDLIAHLVDYEGAQSVLTRWKTENTSLLSAGDDRRSSLNASIAVSLSSPRLMSSPGAKNLLSLLSILPDGLSDVDLIQSKLPIHDVLECKATLLRTALAYYDTAQRLKSLVPIREYVWHTHPASPALINSLQKYFQSWFHLYQKYQGTDQMVGVVNQVTSSMGNIQSVLMQGLTERNPHVEDSIQCTILFSNFRRLIGHSRPVLMDYIPAIFPQLCNRRLEIEFITDELNSTRSYPVINPNLLIDQAISHFRDVDDPALECE
jgi:hypothetical protein